MSRPSLDPKVMAAVSGHSEDHLCSAADAERLGATVHRDVVEPFLQLKEEGKKAGFELEILSGFRDFQRQLSIWNRKARGELAVLDDNAVPLEIGALSEQEYRAIRESWLALPSEYRDLG